MHGKGVRLANRVACFRLGQLTVPLLLLLVLSGRPTFGTETTTSAEVWPRDGPDAILNKINNGTAILADEFEGLRLQYNRGIPGRNDYQMESLALTAINALKEESLEHFYSPLLAIDYADPQDLENPVRIRMHAVTGAPETKKIRRTVMWTVMALVAEMMQDQYFRFLPFRVWFYGEAVYDGVILPRLRENSSVKEPRAFTLPLSLEAVPTSPASISLRNGSSVHDFPHYDLQFAYPGLPLPRSKVFESILVLLLAEGKVNAGAIQEHVQLSASIFNVWIFMAGREPRDRGNPFQQFQAVAILEAFARVLVARDDYHETTYEFRADGHLLSTRPIVKMSSQYDALVAPYNELRKLPGERLEIYNMQQAIKGYITGANILELACGSGHYSHLLVAWGAAQVVGVDISKEIIAAAEATASSDRERFLVADCTVPQKFEGGPFDIVFGGWLLNYARSGAEMANMFRTINLNLKTGGRFFGVTPFPTEDPRRLCEMALQRRPLFWDRLFVDPVDDVDCGITTLITAEIEPQKIQIETYYLSKNVYEKAAKEGGMNGSELGTDDLPRKPQ
ncbi:MAG: hypothetical protein Q9219_004516 [cf. Caloplaca sp. 3 TL-2023]